MRGMLEALDLFRTEPHTQQRFAAAFAQHRRVLPIDSIECALRLARERYPHRSEAHAERCRGINFGESRDCPAQHHVVRVRIDAELSVPATLRVRETEISLGPTSRRLRGARLGASESALRRLAPRGSVA